jgi:serine protease
VDAPAGTWRFQAVLGAASNETTFHVASALPTSATAVEYYNAGFGHYFMTADADEIAGLDAGAFGGAFVRTGRTFGVYATASAGLVPVCRFFTTPGTFGAKSSHFYTADPAECEGLKLNPKWIYEKIAFHAPVPVDGTCPASSLPVYRLYNNGQTAAPNHRFTTDYATRLALASALNWSDEGIRLCTPQ